MSINLEDYQELIDTLSPTLQESLRSAWHEAAKVFSARGLDNYLKGAAALKTLGKGDDLIATWIDHAPPMEYDGLEVALVRFDNGAVGKVSVNADCIMPYRFPLRIFGNLGSVFDNRVWSHKFPGQRDWVVLPAIQPDSVDVSHHPFQGQMDHFVDCILGGRESHCNLEDTFHTHEVIFAAQRCYETGATVRLPEI